MALFSEDDTYDLSNYQIFTNIGEAFSESDEILQYFWNLIPSISQTPSGLYSAIVFLNSSFDNVEFYNDKINDVSRLLISGLQNSSICIRQASSDAISNFAITQKDEIKEVSNNLLSALIVTLSNDQSCDYINAIQNIVNNISEIGEIFDNIYEVLNSLIKSNDISLMHGSINCICSLVKHSPNRARYNFDRILELMIGIISDQEGQYEELKANAINCLSFLIESSTKLFIRILQSFIKFIVSNLNTKNQNN